MPDEHPIKLLLIDDEKFLLNIYSTKFLKLGFDVFACNSVDEGIKTLQEGYRPDAILFDITMPEKNGYEFLEELARYKLGKDSLKIALTNEGQDGEKNRMAELGADLHLVKARFSPAEIAAMVTNLLAERK